MAAVQRMLLQETRSLKGERIIDGAELKCPDCKST